VRGREDEERNAILCHSSRSRLDKPDFDVQKLGAANLNFLSRQFTQRLQNSRLVMDIYPQDLEHIHNSAGPSYTLANFEHYYIAINYCMFDHSRWNVRPNRNRYLVSDVTSRLEKSMSRIYAFVYISEPIKRFSAVSAVCSYIIDLALIIPIKAIGDLGAFVSKKWLTTSMICCRVMPNFTSSGSLSFATGRSKVL